MTMAFKSNSMRGKPERSSLQTSLQRPTGGPPTVALRRSENRRRPEQRHPDPPAHGGRRRFARRRSFAVRSRGLSLRRLFRRIGLGNSGWKTRISPVPEIRSTEHPSLRASRMASRRFMPETNVFALRTRSLPWRGRAIQLSWSTFSATARTWPRTAGRCDRITTTVR